MPKLFSSAHVITVLEENGFVFVSQKGSHMKYRNVSEDKTRTVIVPGNKNEIPHGTFRSILRQSQLQREDFV